MNRSTNAAVLGAQWGCFADLGSSFFQGRIKAGRELAVPIVHNQVSLQPIGSCVSDESLGLLAHPGFVGMLGGRRQEHSAGADMQKGDDKQVLKTFGCQNPFAEEIALPEAGSMDFQELVPGAYASLGPGIQAVSPSYRI